MKLPEHKVLPVNKLAACFNNTSATYKFYWFLSILQFVEDGQIKIAKKDLFARMIANAWYTVNYFHISFGVQDKLQRAIQQIKILESLEIDSDRVDILQRLSATTSKDTLNHLYYFNGEVPHRFLSPWFPGMNQSEVYRNSKQLKNSCMYKLGDDFIEINFNWIYYLSENARLLKDFCFWNLAMYLQAKNPNVPDIPNKLIKPAIRNSLSKQKSQFWDIVIEQLGELKCIYTNQSLTIGNYAVEHFVPFSFVSHDLIWNLIPSDKIFNSRKSDKLPLMDKHFDSFFKTHKLAINIVRTENPKNKYLLDYLTIFPDIEAALRLPDTFMKEKFRESIQPIITIASNNGFEYMR